MRSSGRIGIEAKRPPTLSITPSMHIALLPKLLQSRGLPLALALLLKVSVTFATESTASAQSVLTFVEVRIEMRGHAANVLRQQADIAPEGQTSPAQIVTMQEIARPERFVVLERESPAASAIDARKPHAFADDIADDLIAPPDRRWDRELDGIATKIGQRVDASANFYVIANVDIAASDLTQAATSLHNLAAALRKASGNLGVEILQQINHPNHFNLISAWVGEAPFHAFTASAEAREFRQTIAPLLGSPYDERLFKRVD